MFKLFSQNLLRFTGLEFIDENYSKKSKPIALLKIFRTVTNYRFGYFDRKLIFRERERDQVNSKFELKF